MNQREFAHGFYYYSGVGTQRLGNVSYDRQCYYSYETIIGQKIQDKHGNTQYLISWNSMTTTTAKQLSYLRAACPVRAIYIPMEMECTTPYTAEEAQSAVIKEILSIYRRVGKRKLSRQEDRALLGNLFEQLDKLLVHWDPYSDFIEHEPELAAIRKHLITVTVEKAAKQKERLAKQEARETQLKQDALELVQEEAEFLQGLGYWDRLNLLVFGAVCWQYKGQTLHEHLQQVAKERQTSTKRVPSSRFGEIVMTALREEFGCPLPDWAYLSIRPEASGPVVKTSMGVKMPLAEVIPALRSYKVGRLRHGDSVGQYTVMSVNEDEGIKVGCHKFHPTHLDFFYDLVKEKYPSLLAKQTGGTR